MDTKATKRAIRKLDKMINQVNGEIGAIHGEMAKIGVTEGLAAKKSILQDKWRGLARERMELVSRMEGGK